MRAPKPAILTVQELEPTVVDPQERAWPGKPVAIALFTIAMLTVAFTRALPLYSAAQERRPDLRYEAENGKEYPYLIGQDSFSWVRKAKNVVEHGTPCDAVVGDDCRDFLRHAPVGSTMPYADSFHIYAIAGMHRVMRVFDAKYPIEVSAFWLQVVVGTLGVIPAWLLGRALGGVWAGFFGALLMGLGRNQFERSLGGDNDVWNVVLPVLAAAAWLFALDGKVLWKRVGLAVLAGLVMGLHAWVWSGWIFGFAVLLAAAAGAVGWALLRSFVEADRPAARARAGTLLALAITLVATTALTTLERTEGWKELGSLVGLVERARTGDDETAKAPKLGLVMPDGLRHVGELRVLPFDQVIERLGGKAVVFGALLSLVLLLIPAAASTPFERKVGVAAGLVLALAIFGLDASAVTLGFFTAVAVLLLLGARALRVKPSPHSVYGALLFAAWLAAALYQSLQGQRFVLLAVAPVGLACGVAAGQVVRYVRGMSKESVPAWVAALALALGVGVVAEQGVAYAKSTLPKLNDAWAESLEAIAKEPTPNAIVFAWWPYGYWIEHLGQRGVAVDGSSLLKRISHWLGRALLASDERESVGLMRMLACGSDASGEPEAKLGAYERLRAAGASDFEAYDLVGQLALLGRDSAEKLLRSRGYAPEAVSSILEATHCTPPPAYVMLSDRQTKQRDLLYQGNWDPRRAVIAHRLTALPEATALERITSELGLPRSQGQELLRRARAARDDDAVERFIAPSQLYYTPWIRCRVDEGSGSRVCAPPNAATSVLQSFVFTPDAPERGTIRLRENGAIREKPLELALVAQGKNPRVVPLSKPSELGAAALIDVERNRAMFGPPALIGSVFTRMQFVEQTGLRHFRRIRHESAREERVATFRVRWE